MEVAMRGRLAKYFYLDFKDWERTLLNASDTILMTTTRGVRSLELESPSVNVHFLPISGFDVGTDFDSSFEQRFESVWRNKEYGYVGTIGGWHDADILEKLIVYLSSCIQGGAPYILASNVSNVGSYRAKKLSNIEVKRKLSQSLFSIVSGCKVNSYLTELKMSLNFFSTKAAESLSLGIPIVVNSEIKELADFVTQNNCGFVFHLSDDGQVAISEEVLSRLHSKQFWYTMHENALMAGKKFRRINVIDMLTSIYG